MKHNVKEVISGKPETRRYLEPVSSNANKEVKVKAKTDDGEEKAHHDVFAREHLLKAFHERVVTEIVRPEFVIFGSTMRSPFGSAPVCNGRDNHPHGDTHRSGSVDHKWNARHNEEHHMQIKVDWSDDDEDFKMKYEPLDDEFPYF